LKSKKGPAPTAQGGCCTSGGRRNGKRFPTIQKVTTLVDQYSGFMAFQIRKNILNFQKKQTCLLHNANRSLEFFEIGYSLICMVLF